MTLKSNKEGRWTGGCQDGKNQNGERDKDRQTEE